MSGSKRGCSGVLLVAQVAQHEPARVADLPVGFAQPVEQFVEDADIFDIVDRTDQQAGDFRAPRFDQIVGIDADPFDLDIARPSSSSVQPCVIAAR